MAKIIWLTGLSGAGKTTLCKKIKLYLKNQKCLVVDGDIFRKKSKQFSFSKKNIIKNNLKIINYCKKNFDKFEYILVSVISPLKKTRKYAYRIFKENYFEIHVFASKKTLVKRDTKGLYKAADQGEITDLIGYSLTNPYEEPNDADLILNTDNRLLIGKTKQLFQGFVDSIII